MTNNYKEAKLEQDVADMKRQIMYLVQLMIKHGWMNKDASECQPVKEITVYGNHTVDHPEDREEVVHV